MPFVRGEYETPHPIDQAERVANANYIVQCVNSHEALLEAAKAAVESSVNLHSHMSFRVCTKDCAAQMISAAIAAYEEKP